MTKIEFMCSVNDWMQLLHFCDEIQCDVCEDVMDAAIVDEWMVGELITACREGVSWRDIARLLSAFPEGYEYYRRYGPLEYDGLNNCSDFDSYKSMVADEAEFAGDIFEKGVSVWEIF